MRRLCFAARDMDKLYAMSAVTAQESLLLPRNMLQNFKHCKVPYHLRHAPGRFLYILLKKCNNVNRFCRGKFALKAAVKPFFFLYIIYIIFRA